MAPSSTDWIQAGGSVLAAWVGVGALLYDRHARRAERSQLGREIHAWVRFVDDDPDLEQCWMLYISNGTGVPVESWFLELNTAESLGSGDLGPLPPGTLRRRIIPALDAGRPTRYPRVNRLVFRQRDGKIAMRSGHDRLELLGRWPLDAAGDDGTRMVAS